MKTATLLLFLLTLATFCACNNSTDATTRWIPFTNCLFSYSQDSTGFIFHSCKLKSKAVFIWALCLDQCCSDMPQSSSTPSSQAIALCVQNASQSDNKKTMITIAILSCLLGLLFICCCCILIGKANRHHHQNQVHVEHKYYAQGEWAEQRQINQEMQNLKWSSQARKDHKVNNTKDICCICLEGNTFAELFCGHSFHPYCIGQWLKKGGDCPCCRHQHIRCIKVYCKGCLYRYLVCTKKLLKDHSKELPHLCNRCKQKKSRKQSEEVIIEDSKFCIDFDKVHVARGERSLASIQDAQH